ncbi:PmoA family protein [Balneolales bacterium ANBcel1]|nr:PmoA family protein [Balneolales bacterium ANBcel1]
MLKISILAAVILTHAAGACLAVNQTSWMVQSHDRELFHEPVHADVPSEMFQEEVICLSSEHGLQTAQIERVDDRTSRVWWMVSQPKGSAIQYTVDRDAQCGATPFAWREAGPQSDRLLLGEKPVLQYEHPVYDADDVEHTKKPFHHVFSPSGVRFITKGPGGLFSHHRGIFLGYYAYVDGSDERIDIWHARDGERSEHNRVIRRMEGPVLGGHVVSIDWKDHSGETFLDEVREIRTFRQPDGHLLVDVRSELTALESSVFLGGDRHHAGLQFRAAQEVADNSEATRFIRPDAWSDVPPDEELESGDILDFPWNAMVFEVEGRTYTVAYMSHPTNPRGAEMSERLYGRFGEFFEQELAGGETLVMNYRFWIRGGEAPDRSEIERRYDNYANPPEVKD